MKTLRARISLLFAASATAALAILFAAGYQLLHTRLLASLDAMINGQGSQIAARLEPDADVIDPETLRRRIHAANEHLSDLIYIAVESPRAGGRVTYRSGRLLGQPIRAPTGADHFETTLPGIGRIRAAASRIGPFDVVVATPLAPVERTMASYVAVALALLVAMVPAGASVGFALGHLALAPVRAISATADRIRSDNLGERIPVGAGDDEIARLARLLNQMFDRLEAAFDQVRRFSDEASHELKTPLSLIRLHAEGMMRDRTLPNGHAEAVVVQLEEIARLDRIIDELLFLSRAEAGAVVLRPQPQDPERLLRAFSQDARTLSEHRGCRYSYAHEGTGRAVIEETWMRQVLFNLLANALDVSPRRASIRLASRIDASGWRVALEDEGPGLAPAQRERMFDRFVRFNIPRDADRGSGLGLAICRKIVELHGGRIYASDRLQGTGLRVVFEVPVAS